jgi:hypothetical protein
MGNQTWSENSKIIQIKDMASTKKIKVYGQFLDSKPDLSFQKRIVNSSLYSIKSS